MTNVQIIAYSPMVQALLEGYVASFPDFTLSEPAALVLLDVQGLDRLPALKSRTPAPKVLVMTDRPDPGYPVRAKALGADGFWYQLPDASALQTLLQDILAGDHPFPEDTPAVQLGDAKSSHLTRREMEVLRQIVEGKTDAQISQELSMAVATVKHHIQQLRMKTGLANRTQLAVYARDCGLIYPTK